MLGYLSREALQKTIDTGLATFFSRSRNSLWTKGETSGHVLRVSSILLDCDADTLLLLVDPEGPSCHTGRANCFFRRLEGGALRELPTEAGPFLVELENLIRERQNSTGEKSYTRSLLDGGAPKIGAKLREEAGELAQAIAEESDERVASEAADVLYHLMVGLRARQVNVRQVMQALAARMGVSGHEEKARRGPAK